MTTLILTVRRKPKTMEKERNWHKTEGKRAWMEVNTQALLLNLAQFRQLLPCGSRIMAVVKADGYGHGAVLTAGRLEKAGVTDFAVAAVSEGIKLRCAGISGNILILGYTSPQEWPHVLENDLIQTIVDEDYARQMSRWGCENRPLRAQLAVDTGMHRLGVAAEDMEAVERILQLPGICLEGMFSHLCVADSRTPSDRAYTEGQIRAFETLRDRVGGHLCFHLQSSYGLLNYPWLRYDFVRLGIALYGVCSSPDDRPMTRLLLQPVMSVRARVAMVRAVQQGAELGYGRAYRANSARQIAAVTIGYADGIPRNYGESSAQVLIHGHRCPVVGRICMDQLLADVTELTDTVRPGDIVTLIGTDGGEQITAEEVAGWCGTITNELLCRMGDRLERLETGSEAECGTDMDMQPESDRGTEKG